MPKRRQSTIPQMFNQRARNNYTPSYRRGTFWRDAAMANRSVYGPPGPRSLAFKGVNLRARTKRALGDTESRSVTVGKKGKKLFTMSDVLKNMYNSICPKVSFEHRMVTYSMETLSNEERTTEFLLNGFYEVQTGFEKIRQQPPAGVNYNLSSLVPLSSNELRYVYEGGTYEFTLKNTCTHTVFLELRVYKTNAQQTGTYGLLMGQSPLKLWSIDEANDVNGDKWYGENSLVGPTNSGLDRVSTLPIQTTNTPNRSNNHIANVSLHDLGKRPKRTATNLHRMYDLESVKSVTLKPGETLVYTVQMPKFFQPLKVDPIASDSSPIQRYSRFLWITQSGEFVTDTTTDTPKMAPGSTQLTCSCKTTHVYRGLISTKTGFKIQSTDSAGITRGGMDDIAQDAEATINEETNTEQIYAEIGLTNAN